jgi:hypothetical protein
MTRINRNRNVVGILGFIVGLFLTADAFANGFTLRANSVPNLTTRNVVTVPVGQAYLVTDVVIAKDGATAACCQRLFRSGADVTAFISVPSQSSTQVHFEQGILYTAGQVIQVRNGASSGGVSFTIHGKKLLQ